MMSNPFGPVKGRAKNQASANIETVTAKVTFVYTDTVGNITAADVRMHGNAYDLRRVSNASGLRLWVGATVTMNFRKGSPFNTQITGLSGAESSAVVSSSTTSYTNVNNNNGQTLDISTYPLLLQAGDDRATNGYVEDPGSNVYFTDTPPVTTSGGRVNGRRRIDAIPLVMSSLPNPATTTLYNSTVVDLVDSYGNGLGMYRLNRSTSTWVRRDVQGGGGGGGGGTGTVTSVGLSAPSMFNVSGSPVTSSGNLVFTLASQSQNLFFMSPSGGSGAPTFRAPITADIPNSIITVAKLAATGTPSASTFLRGDDTWSTPSVPQVDVYSAAGSFTWNQPAGATRHFVQVWASGGGGGAGRLDSAGDICGGAGGSGGGYAEAWYAAGDLLSSETVLVGGGGTGHAGQTSNGNNGLPGIAGNESYFGAHIRAAANLSGGGGGNTTGVTGPTGAGFNFGGAAIGGNGGPGSIGQANGGGPSAKGGGGGGGGGGVAVATGSVVKNGGGQGHGWGIRDQITSVPIGGGGTAPGGAGAPGTSRTSTHEGGDGGAGGASGIAVAGGDGGVGGHPGGGGGGGGASRVTTSGAGGDGADGMIIVSTYF